MKPGPVKSSLQTVETNMLLRRQVILLICMYFGYASFLLMKTSIVAAGPAILADPSLALSKAEWGMILGCGTLGGILGKFVSGWSSDRLGGKIVFTAGLLLTSLGISGFSFGGEFFVFAMVYFIVLLANASGWPSMAKLIGNWFEPSQYGRVWGLISTSSRVGTVLATLTVGSLLRFMQWRQMLWVAGAIGGVLFLLAGFMIRETPPVPIALNPTQREDTFNDHPFGTVSLKEAVILFFKSKQFLLICGSMMGLTILWDFLNFVPLYLNESLKISTADAALATSSFPIGSLTSVLIGGFIFDKFSQRTVTKIMGFYLAVAVLSLIVVLVLPQWTLTETQKLYSMLGALFFFGFAVSPAYYLPMSIFSIKFGGPHSGFLIALLDAVGFAASVAFSFIGGHLASEPNGWGLFFRLLIAIAIFSLVITVWFLNGEVDSTQP